MHPSSSSSFSFSVSSEALAFSEDINCSILDQRLGYVFGHFFVAGKIGISVEDKQHARRAW
jgi:hypothetical protein